MASNLWRPAPWYGWVWEAGDDEDGLLWVPGHTYFMPTSNGGDWSGWPHLIYILQNFLCLSYGKFSEFFEIPQHFAFRTSKINKRKVETALWDTLYIGIIIKTSTFDL